MIISTHTQHGNANVAVAALISAAHRRWSVQVSLLHMYIYTYIYIYIKPFNTILQCALNPLSLQGSADDITACVVQLKGF
jgi:hypothetical protein